MITLGKCGLLCASMIVNATYYHTASPASFTLMVQGHSFFSLLLFQDGSSKIVELPSNLPGVEQIVYFSFIL